MIINLGCDLIQKWSIGSVLYTFNPSIRPYRTITGSFQVYENTGVGSGPAMLELWMCTNTSDFVHFSQTWGVTEENLASTHLLASYNLTQPTNSDSYRGAGGNEYFHEEIAGFDHQNSQDFEILIPANVDPQIIVVGSGLFDGISEFARVLIDMELKD